MWRNMSYKRITDLDRLCFLLWKNYKLATRTKSKTISLIAVPILFTSVFIVVRILKPDIQVDHKFYPSLNITHGLKVLNESHLAFKSHSYKEAPQVMKRIEKILKLNNSIEVYSDADLQTYLSTENPYRIGGIIFQNEEDQLTVTIRVAGCKSKFYSVQHWWNTDLLYPWLVEVESRFVGSKTGGKVPGYMETGFMAIQSAVSIAYINQLSNSTRFPEIRIQRFSEPPYMLNQSLTFNKIVLNVGTLIGFYFVCLYNVKSIVLEKEMKFKMAMKMMGLGDFLHWCAWFIEFVLIFMCMAIVMICGWKFGGVFAYSNAGILIAVYLTYAVALATFCFLLSALFSKSATASIFILIIWCITFVPYYLSLKNTKSYRYMAGLSLNTAMYFFIDILYNQEALEQGIQRNNYYDSVWFEKPIGVADCVYMFIIDFVLYAIIAWYLNKVFPGEYGIPAKWYFPFHGLFNFNQDLRQVFGTFEPGDNYEKGPDGKQPAIRLIGLTKIYSNATLGLDSVTMNVYDNEITVLLGENGAGKSTLLSVLTGLFPPTNGTAIMNEFDIRTHMDLIHESLGVCPQHNVLFDLLTVEEHLIFFSKLKGCRTPEAKYEANKYITQLDMKEKANARVATISMGMKRRLCLAIALCGDSKVILCDEPTAGMDPVARKAVWDLLQVEKASRIIVLSTHIMEEADILADRVAILQNGKLKCYGTPNFLKELYGGAKFKLVCEKTDNSDIDGITKTVQKYVPSATVAMNMAAELSFKLDVSYRIKFPALLAEIEDNAGRLGLQGYGISLTGMEEVFFRVLIDNSDVTAATAGDGSDSKILNPVEGYPTDVLYRSQVLGLLLKKIYYTKYSCVNAIVQLILPALLIFIMLKTVRDPSQKYREEPPLKIAIASYLNEPVSILSSPISQLGFNYAWHFDAPPVGLMLEINDNISDFLMNRVKNVHLFRMTYLVGASLNENPIVVWFNNQPYHTIPLTLNLLFNAQLKMVAENLSLAIINHPLPELKGGRENVNDSKVQDVIGDVLVLVIFDLAMFIMVAYYVIECVRERHTRLKLMQYISGVNPFSYWLVAMIYDFCLVMITIGLVILVYVAEVKILLHPSVSLLFILMAYAGAVLPFVYLRSFRYSNATAAFLNILILGIILGTLLQFAVSKCGPYVSNDEQIKNITELVLQTIPFYNLAFSTEHVWLAHDIYESEWDFALSSGVMINVLMFGATGLFLFFLLMMDEVKLWWLMTYAVSGRKVGTTNDATMDADVIKERDYVASMGQSNIDVLNVVCQKLCKSYYDDQLAVNDLSFTIEGSQCFGLLGANGAGKTTLFKLLTGDERVSSGEAWVLGKSLKRQLRSVYRKIGYCPQEEALMEDFTGRETLKVFCLLTGISTDIVEQVSLEFAHNLGFLGHIDKKVKELSGGNRRKLAVALAMLNKPKVLLMDEPTSGLDPSAKRQMWRMISSHRDFGKSILLSSQSMEECEVLCSRLTIMVNGQLKCIGTTQHLRARFANGYSLIIQMNRSKTNLMQPGSEMKIQKVQEFVNSTFPGSTLQENYQGRLCYQIPMLRGLRWSSMFAKMESVREQLDIESYILKQLGLDHVFRTFTQSQLQDHRLNT